MKAEDTKDYFEKGCLCILTGKLPVVPGEGVEAAAERYMTECRCSRGFKPFDEQHDNQLRAEYKTIQEKTHDAN